MTIEAFIEYKNIKASTPAELDLIFSILGVAEISKNKKVIMLIREGGIEFSLACKVLNTKYPTAKRTANRVELGLIKINKYMELKDDIKKNSD